MKNKSKIFNHKLQVNKSKVEKLPEIHQKREAPNFSKRIFPDRQKNEFNPVTGAKVERRLEEILRKKIEENSNFLISQMGGLGGSPTR